MNPQLFRFLDGGVVSSEDDPGNVPQRDEGVGQDLAGEVAAVDEAGVVDELVVVAVEDRPEPHVQRIEAALRNGVGGVPKLAKVHVALETSLGERQ